MATIKTLNINLTMGVAAFTKGSKSVVGQIKKMSDAVFSFKGALVGLGVAMVGNAVTSWIGDHIAAIDSLNDAAIKLSTSTARLSQFGHAAQMSGASAETFQAGLSNMVAVMGKADEDSDKAAEAFAELGLSILELQTEDPTEAFIQISEAINALPNEYQRVSAAARIFGKAAGPELLQMMSQGREGINALRQEAKDFGISVSEIDAQKIAQAADALDRMKAIWVGIGQTVAIEVSPYIVAVSKSISEFAKGGKFVGFIKDMFRGFLIVLAKVLDALESIARVIGKVSAGAKWLKDVTVDAALLSTPGGLHTFAARKSTQGKQAAAPQSSGEALLSGFDETFANIEKRANDEAKKMAKENYDKRFNDRLNAIKERDGAEAKQKAEEYKKAAEEFDKIKMETLKQIAEGERRIEQARLDASKKFADNLKESLKSPTEKLRDQLTEISESMRDGFLGGADFNQWRNKTLEDLKKQEADLTKTEARKVVIPNALKRGSADEINAVSSFFSGGHGLEPIKQLDKTQKETLLEIKKQTRVLENIKPAREEIIK